MLPGGPFRFVHVDANMTACTWTCFFADFDGEGFPPAKTTGGCPVVCPSIANAVDIVLPRNLGSVGWCTRETFRLTDFRR